MDKRGQWWRVKRAVTQAGKVLTGRQMAGRAATIFPDDVYLVSYPRSGNTWTRFLLGNFLYPTPATFSNIEQRVAELADLLGVGHLLDRWPQGLSGGEAQRTALGRALSFRPRVLLLDEPLSALDDETREEMYDLLRTVHRETGVTALHVTHSLTEAKKLGDCLLLLRDGKVGEMA